MDIALRHYVKLMWQLLHSQISQIQNTKIQIVWTLIQTNYKKTVTKVENILLTKKIYLTELQMKNAAFFKKCASHLLGIYHGRKKNYVLYIFDTCQVFHFLER